MFRIAKTISVPENIKFEEGIIMKCKLKMLKSGKEVVLARGRYGLNDLWEGSIKNAVEYKHFKIKLKPVTKKKKNQIIRRNKKGFKQDEIAAILNCLFVISKNKKTLKSPRKLLTISNNLNENAKQEMTSVTKSQLISFAVKINNFEGEIISQMNDLQENDEFIFIEYHSIYEKKEVFCDKINFPKNTQSADKLELEYSQIHSIFDDFFEIQASRMLFLKLISKNRENKKKLLGFLKINLIRLREKFFELVKFESKSVWKLQSDFNTNEIKTEKLEKKDIEILNTKGQIIGFTNLELWVGTQSKLRERPFDMDHVHQLQLSKKKGTKSLATQNREITPEPKKNPVISHRFPELAGHENYFYENTFGNNKYILDRKGISDVLPRNFILPETDFKSLQGASYKSKEFSQHKKSIKLKKLVISPEPEKSVAISKVLKIPKLTNINSEETKSVLPSPSAKRTDLLDQKFDLTSRVNQLIIDSGSGRWASNPTPKTNEDHFSENYKELKTILNSHSMNHLKEGSEGVVIEQPYLTQVIGYFQEQHPEINLNRLQEVLKDFQSYSHPSLAFVSIERIDLFLMFSAKFDVSDLLISAHNKIKKYNHYPECPSSEFILSNFSEEILGFSSIVDSDYFYALPRNKELLLSLFTQLLGNQLGLDDRLILQKDLLPNLHQKHISTYFEQFFKFFILLKFNNLFEDFCILLEPFVYLVNIENFSFEESIQFNKLMDQGQYEHSIEMINEFFETNEEFLNINFQKFFEMCHGLSSIDVEIIENKKLQRIANVCCFSSIINFIKIIHKIFDYVADVVLKGKNASEMNLNLLNNEELFYNDELFNELGPEFEDFPAKSSIDIFNSATFETQEKIQAISENLFCLALRILPGLIILSNFQQSIIVKLKFDAHFQEMIPNKEQFIQKICLLFLNYFKNGQNLESEQLVIDDQIWDMEMDLGIFLNLRMVEYYYYSGFCFIEFVYFYKFLCKTNNKDFLTLKHLVKYFYQLTSVDQNESAEFDEFLKTMPNKLTEQLAGLDKNFSSVLKTWREESKQNYKNQNNSRIKPSVLENFVQNFSIHDQTQLEIANTMRSNQSDIDQQNLHDSIKAKSLIGSNQILDQHFPDIKDKVSQFGQQIGDKFIEEKQGQLIENERNMTEQELLEFYEKVHNSQLQNSIKLEEIRKIEEISKEGELEKLKESKDLEKIENIEKSIELDESKKSEKSEKSEKNKKSEKSKSDKLSLARTSEKQSSIHQTPKKLNQEIGVPCEILGIEVQNIQSQLFLNSLKDSRLCVRISSPNLCSVKIENIDSHVEINKQTTNTLQFSLKSENIIPKEHDSLISLTNNSFPDFIEIELLELSKKTFKKIANARVPLSNLTRLANEGQSKSLLSDVVLTNSNSNSEVFGKCTIDLSYKQEYRAGKEFQVKRRFPREGVIKVDLLQITKISNVFSYLDKLQGSEVLDNIIGQEVSLELSISPEWKKAENAEDSLIIKKYVSPSKAFNRLVIESPKKLNLIQNSQMHCLSLSQISENIHNQNGPGQQDSRLESFALQEIPYHFANSHHVIWRYKLDSLEDLIQILKDISSISSGNEEASEQCFFIPDISKPFILNFLLRGCLKLDIFLKFNGGTRLDFGQCKVNLDKIFEVSSIEGKVLKEKILNEKQEHSGYLKVCINYLPELMNFRKAKTCSTNVFSSSKSNDSKMEKKSSLLREQFNKMNSSFQVFQQKINHQKNNFHSSLENQISNNNFFNTNFKLPDSPNKKKESENWSVNKEDNEELSKLQTVLETRKELQEKEFSNCNNYLSNDHTDDLDFQENQSISNALETLKELNAINNTNEEIPSDLLDFMKNEVFEEKPKSEAFGNGTFDEEIERNFVSTKDFEQIKELSLQNESLEIESVSCKQSETQTKKNAIQEYKEYLVDGSLAFQTEKNFYKKEEDQAPECEEISIQDKRPNYTSMKAFEKNESIPQVSPKKQNPSKVDHQRIFKSHSEEEEGESFEEFEEDSIKEFKEKAKKPSVIERLPKNLFKKEELDRIQRILSEDRFGFRNKLTNIDSDSSDSDGY